MKWLNLSDHINLMSLIAALVILLLTALIVNFYIRKMKTAKPKGELSEEKWDGIGKFENNLPIGWAFCFVIVLLWGFWYFFIGYPLSSYSQIGEYNEEVAKAKEKYQAKLANLTQDQLVAMGESIFLVQCSQCHGVTADGQNGKAQNLLKWGKEEGIIHTIDVGSKGLDFALGEMAPMVDQITPADTKAVAAYVMAEISEVKKTKNPADVAKGKEVFLAQCSACHGEDGKGMEGSAADLSTYGTPQFLSYVLSHGKKGMIGIMPSFNYAGFSEIQIKALSAYIQSLEFLGE